MVNYVSRIYEPFTPEEVSRKISDLVRPREVPWQGEVEILYQSIENLDAALPSTTGCGTSTGNIPLLVATQF